MAASSIASEPLHPPPPTPECSSKKSMGLDTRTMRSPSLGAPPGLDVRVSDDVAFPLAVLL